MPNISLTATDPNTGESETHIFNPEDLVSVTLPFQSPVINRQYIRRLVAKDWRHKETGWYDDEQKTLSALTTQNPHADHFINELRVLLYAVFVKEAAVRHQGRLLTASMRRFTKEYDKFCKKWQCYPRFLKDFELNTPQGADEYLQLVSISSYFENRYAVLLPMQLSHTTKTS